MIAQADMFPEARVLPEDTDERYTPRAFILELERQQGHRFTLDVAACAESHHAERYFTKSDDGLARSWAGEHVWCNPPFSDIEPWVVKAWLEAGSALSVTMLLPAWTDRRWWQAHVEPFRDGRSDGPVTLTTQFLARIKFGHPGNPDAVGKGSADFWCVLLRWRR